MSYNGRIGTVAKIHSVLNIAIDYQADVWFEACF